MPRDDDKYIKHANLIHNVPWVILVGATSGIVVSKKKKDMIKNGIIGAAIGGAIQYLLFPAVGAQKIDPVLAPPSGDSIYKYARNPVDRPQPQIGEYLLD